MVHPFVPWISLAADGILRGSNGTTRQVILLPETAVIAVQLVFHDNVELTT